VEIQVEIKNAPPFEWKNNEIAKEFFE